MPKVKSDTSAGKRFKITKTGKVMHRPQGISHLKKAKSKNNLRRLKRPGELYHPFAVKIKEMLIHFES